MPRHNFGIMQIKPVQGVRFDEYEPEKYNCITIDDAFIEPLLPELSDIDFYWHTIDIPGKGLAYYGITLIPPESLNSMIDKISNITNLSLLKQLLIIAINDNKFVIHIGM